MIEATLKNHRQSPRKVRLVADLVRGKKVDRAMTILDFLSKQASEPVRGVLQMAIANAKNNFATDAAKLYVRDIRVDEGVVMKRHMPRAHGSAYPIKKRTSRIHVVLDSKSEDGILSVVPAKKNQAADFDDVSDSDSYNKE
jgi:large subunit ribosomal protein L22